MTDWILRGGEVIDGSGRPRRRADIAILGDRIAALGDVDRSEGGREIDVDDVHGVYRATILLTLCLSHAVLPVDGASRGRDELIA